MKIRTTTAVSYNSGRKRDGFGKSYYPYRVWDDPSFGKLFQIPGHIIVNMSGWETAILIGWMILVGSAAGQQKPADQPPPSQQEQAPPEEDEAQKPKEYSFNPLQAEHEVKIGNFYFHKGKYRAAEQRFREATRWNPNLAEAYVRLGDAAEKEKDWNAAREAYEKFVELAADDKRTPEVRKKIAKLPKGKA